MLRSAFHPLDPSALWTTNAGVAKIELSLGWNKTAVSLAERLHNSLSANQGRVLNLTETARRILVDGLIAEAGIYSKNQGLFFSGSEQDSSLSSI